MKKTRKLIEIDEALCNGCGQCILSCAEGALELLDGKAKLVGEIYCDGLGACLGDCPTGALTITEQEAEDFDEAAVAALLKEKEGAPSPASIPPAGGCPGARSQALKPAGSKTDENAAAAPSELSHWPIKLQLLGPQAPFLQGADLVLLADCVGVSYPDLHRRILRDHVVAIGCPKLDNLTAHIEKLTTILQGAHPKSLTVVHMEVPCCRGFVVAAQKAVAESGIELPLKRMMISLQGAILEEETL